MSILKNLIRYSMASISTKLDLTETLRSFYLNKAHHYVLSLNDQAVPCVWIRRSVTNQDFIPFLSDVDLTLVLDEKYLNQLHLPIDLLVKDIQIIPKAFFKTWMEAGGYRNYQQDQWISLRGKKALQHQTMVSNPAHLAFDLAHEIYLLFHQLENKLHLAGDPYTRNARKKILQDLLKIETFWIKRDDSILNQTRTSFEIPKTIDKFIPHFAHFCESILNHLDSPLDTFKCSDLLIKDFTSHFEVNMQMLGKPVIAVRDVQNFSSILENHPSHFVAPEIFINLVKGVGVQEQTLLNQLAKDKTSHYFKFNQQRLALDLIGAVVHFPENQTQLYYCFKSIQDFIHTVEGSKDAPEWNNIQQLWNSEAKVFETPSDLFRLNKAYLEVLRTIG
jgi:hypothetical protein